MGEFKWMPGSSGEGANIVGQEMPLIATSSAGGEGSDRIYGTLGCPSRLLGNKYCSRNR